ncbi:hypothetical protein E2C01_086520 [Portunus trituberculatus]|uniref:Uncharacterized protein n=1 Tax=Portunus trituberculatus TaxID=210409 RepID=A0A5B7J415_PORTR|nr:hypothetical protein [Portunus trituberculatus]
METCGSSGKWRIDFTVKHPSRIQAFTSHTPLSFHYEYIHSLAFRTPTPFAP